MKKLLKGLIIFSALACMCVAMVGCSAKSDTYMVPEGATYIVGLISTNDYAEDGRLIYEIDVENLKVSSGEEMPDASESGFHYLLTEDYIYSRAASDSNWELSNVLDRTQSKYEDVLKSINGMDVVSINSAFVECRNMTKTPKLPDTIKYMKNSFTACENLKEVTNFPKDVLEMDCAFKSCTELEIVPDIPDGANSLLGTFEECTSLNNAPYIPESVNEMRYTFMFSGVSGEVKIDATPENYEMCLFGVTNEISVVGKCENKEDILNTK